VPRRLGADAARQPFVTTASTMAADEHPQGCHLRWVSLQPNFMGVLGCRNLTKRTMPDSSASATLVAVLASFAISTTDCAAELPRSPHRRRSPRCAASDRARLRCTRARTCAFSRASTLCVSVALRGCPAGMGTHRSEATFPHPAEGVAVVRSTTPRSGNSMGGFAVVEGANHCGGDIMLASNHS
jgi:hypothetical protein